MADWYTHTEHDAGVYERGNAYADDAPSPLDRSEAEQDLREMLQRIADRAKGNTEDARTLDRSER